MTATTTHEDRDPAHADDEHHAHPSDAQYWKVGALLGIITLLEVGTYFITDDPYSHDLKWLLIVSLLGMMTLKFIIIGSYFMHLKFDNKVFRNIFITGMVLAVAVYLVVLTVFTYWDSGYEQGLAVLLR